MQIRQKNIRVVVNALCSSVVLNKKSGSNASPFKDYLIGEVDVEEKDAVAVDDGE